MMIIPIYTSYLIYRTYQCCLAKKADKILPTIYNRIAVDMRGYDCKYSDLDGAIRHLGQDYSHSMIKLAYNQLIEDGKLTTYYTPEMYKFTRILYVGILVPLIIDYSINQYSSIDYVYIYNNLSINAANILNFTISSTSTAFFSARDKLYSAFEGIINFANRTFDYVSTTNTNIMHNYFNSINSYCCDTLDYIYNFTSYSVEAIFLSTEKILKNMSNSNLFQGITMSINIDDFITKTKDFTKPCYCVAVGTIGNIAKIGSIASHYYGLIFIHNKLFSYGEYFVNMLPYSSNISSYIKTFKIAKYSIDLLKHMNTFAPEFIPNALKLTGSLSGSFGLIYTSIAVATESNKVFDDAKKIASTFENSVENTLMPDGMCGDNPKGIIDLIFG